MDEELDGWQPTNRPLFGNPMGVDDRLGAWAAAFNNRMRGALDARTNARRILQTPAGDGVAFLQALVPGMDVPERAMLRADDLPFIADARRLLAKVATCGRGLRISLRTEAGWVRIGPSGLIDVWIGPTNPSFGGDLPSTLEGLACVAFVDEESDGGAG